MKKCIAITNVIGFSTQFMNWGGCCNCSEDKQSKTLTGLQKKAIEIKEAVRKDEDKLVNYIKTKFKLNDKDIIRKTFSFFTDYVIETFLKAIEDGEKVDNAREEDKENLRKEYTKKYEPFFKSFGEMANNINEEYTNMSKDTSIGFPVLIISHEVKIPNVDMPISSFLFVINRENTITKDALDAAGFELVSGTYKFKGEYPEDLKEPDEADDKKN